MFEQLNPDPGERGLEKAGRIFYIVAAFNAIAVPLSFFVYRDQPFVVAAFASAVSLVVAVLAFITGRGIEAQQKWAKWLGIALAIISLLNLPVGTIIGIAMLVYINRASKAGLLAA
jgi:hypothetical protein